MPESDETQEDIRKIRWRMENLDNKFDMLVRGNDDVMEVVADVFRGDPSMAQVYLAVNGSRNQQEIVGHIDPSRSTVSRKIRKLDDYGLIQTKEVNGGLIYQKDELHDILALEHRVDPESGWNDD